MHFSTIAGDVKGSEEALPNPEEEILFTYRHLFVKVFAIFHQWTIAIALSFTQLSGFPPAGTTASFNIFEYLKSLGAIHVGRDLIAEVRRLAAKPIGFTGGQSSISAADTQQVRADLLASGNQMVIGLQLKVRVPKDKTVIAAWGY
ncbi:hypothetical protein GALMADRAFT_146225 [Galerina marginata CBS 339.88]|uniref:Uncharacterized protein n=1 Tax=Galerina marginata (strain CBS 339.88) TaxID=685588 RepID=A0A067SCF8_GALM3|nr:hypothetical protein GALMADRAFT_146225 [Galerina marginata CBS 339.88]